MIIQIIYIIASLVAVAATIPQVKQLLLTKESDELNLTSWSTWTAYQIVATAYGMSIHAWLYVAVSTAWVAFYVTMLALIIKYRRPIIQFKQKEQLRRATPVMVPVEATRLKT